MEKVSFLENITKYLTISYWMEESECARVSSAFQGDRVHERALSPSESAEKVCTCAFALSNICPRCVSIELVCEDYRRHAYLSIDIEYRCCHWIRIAQYLPVWHLYNKISQIVSISAHSVDRC